MHEQDKPKIGWCGYCKIGIETDEPYRVKGKKMYHPECLIQKYSFHDSFDEITEKADRRYYGFDHPEDDQSDS